MKRRDPRQRRPRPPRHPQDLTVAGAGAGERPVTLRVPVGVSVGELIAAAGGATPRPQRRRPPRRRHDGPPRPGLDEPVTKDEPRRQSSSGHSTPLVGDTRRPWRTSRGSAVPPATSAASARSCARDFLIGHPIEPTRRCGRLGFTGVKDRNDRRHVYCCDGNLCTLFSCPRGPRLESVCVGREAAAREKGLFFRGGGRRT